MWMQNEKRNSEALSAEVLKIWISMIDSLIEDWNRKDECFSSSRRSSNLHTHDDLHRENQMNEDTTNMIRINMIEEKMKRINEKKKKKAWRKTL